MTLAPVESTRFELMEKVIDLDIDGYTETMIAKKLNIKRKDVLELLADYRAALSQDMLARDLARDHLHKMVKQYDRLIRRYNELINDIDSLHFSHQVAGQKNAALKAIADLEAKRVDALQKAGLLESGDLGDELVEMEEKQAIVVDILRNDLCDACKQKVAYKLSQVSGRAEVISSEVIEGI